MRKVLADEIEKGLLRATNFHDLMMTILVELPGGSGPVATNRGGTPVGFFPWQSAEEELRLEIKELGRLVSQRVRPERVVILSPHVMDKSAFAGREKIGEWPLFALYFPRGRVSV